MYKWIKRKRTKNQTNIFRFSFSSSSSERKKEQHVGEKSEKVLLQQENYNYFLSGFFCFLVRRCAIYLLCMDRARNANCSDCKKSSFERERDWESKMSRIDFALMYIVYACEFVLCWCRYKLLLSVSVAFFLLLFPLYTFFVLFFCVWHDCRNICIRRSENSLRNSFSFFFVLSIQSAMLVGWG